LDTWFFSLMESKWRALLIHHLAMPLWTGDFYLFFEVVSHSVVQVVLELAILFSASKCWDLVYWKFWGSILPFRNEELWRWDIEIYSLARLEVLDCATTPHHIFILGNQSQRL
jgi:hypothetical protein